MRKAVTVIALLCTTTAAQAQGFKAVWVAGPNDIWGAGNMGTLMHGVNGAWTALPSNVQTDLRSIWGSAPTDVWIVGDAGTILRWNGRAVIRAYSPAQTDFIQVTGCGANDVWVLGQSEDDRQPPPLFHWNGTAWTSQTLPVAFRAANLTLTCGSVVGAGAGGGVVTVAGATYFDPRPTERRAVGVVARYQNGAWTSLGWNGRAVTDERLGGTAWTGAVTNGGVTLLTGGENGVVLLLSRGGAWTQLPAPPAPYERAIVTGDGSPVLIMSDGFARLVAGQWRVTGGPPPTSQRNDAEVQRIQRRMEVIGNEIQAGRMTPALMQELQQLQQQYMQAATGQTGTTEQIVASQVSQAQNQLALSFGGEPGVFAPRTGSDFYVATSSGSLVRVSGTTPTILYSPVCASNASLCGR